MKEIKTLKTELKKEQLFAINLSLKKEDKRQRKKHLDKVLLLRQCILILENTKDEKFLQSQFNEVEKKLNKVYDEINSLIKDKPYLKKSTAFIQLNKTFDLKTLEHQHLILKTILK